MINSELKKIEFYGRVLYYKIVKCDTQGYYWHSTNFYETNNKYKVVPKYPILNFLNIITDTKVVTDNKFLFNLSINIDSRFHTKSDIRKRIKKEIQFLDREVEIRNGQII